MGMWLGGSDGQPFVRVWVQHVASKVTESDGSDIPHFKPLLGRIIAFRDAPLSAPRSLSLPARRLYTHEVPPLRLEPFVLVCVRALG